MIPSEPVESRLSIWVPVKTDVARAPTAIPGFSAVGHAGDGDAKVRDSGDGDSVAGDAAGGSVEFSNGSVAEGPSAGSC
jgi:hypothetical protein